jgi:hypothetical protein
MLLQWLTFASATLAAAFSGRRAVQGWLYDQRDRMEARRVERAGWSRGGVNTWTIRAVEPDGAVLDPAQQAATVTLLVSDPRGLPSAAQAAGLRRYLEEHEHLSRNPTPAELDTLDEAAADGGRLAITRARRGRLAK